MEYTGHNKTAAKLMPGDNVTVTGYGNDAAEIEEIAPAGPGHVRVVVSNGAAVTWPANKVVRLYD